MKKNLELVGFLRKAVFLFLVLFISPKLWAVNESMDRVFKFEESNMLYQSFACNEQSNLSITNKYGDINFTNWDKDSIAITVSILAQADRQDHAKMLLQLAEIEFRIVNNDIQANLLWGKELSAVKRTAVETMLTMRSDQRIQINFMVSLPKYLTVKLENRFGDIHLPSEIKKCYISLHHGDLNAEKIKDARSITVRYGKINIKEMENGEFDLGFSDLNLLHAVDITVKSSNSELNLEEVASLNIKSTNDKIYIEKINKMSGSSSFSTIRIRSLTTSIQLVLKFGGLTIKKVNPGFSGINLSGSSTDVSLAFDPNSGFKCMITMDNQKSFNSGFGLSQLNENRVDKTVFYEGSVGKNATENKMTISLKSSHLRLEPIN